jgi:hypothetical protein
MAHLDLICELRGTKEAQTVLDHFKALDTPIYTQKTDWCVAQSVDDMPTRHQEGSIFISRKGPPFAKQAK